MGVKYSKIYQDNRYINVAFGFGKKFEMILENLFACKNKKLLLYVVRLLILARLDQFLTYIRFKAD